MKPLRSVAFTAAVACACTLSACSGNARTNGQTTPPPIATAVPAATTEVETVTWNIGAGEPATLDPALSATEAVSTVVGNMCESLFTLDRDNQPQPALASRIDHPDPLTYVVHLRDGVTFWDGKPVTAEDVVYSIQRVLKEELGSSWISWATHMDSVRSTAAGEVTIKLKQADAVVPNYFAMPSFTIVEKEFAEAAGSNFGTAKGGVMCTGPYKFTGWTQGQNITLTRNDTWWNTAVKPKVKNLRFTFITDPFAQTAALNSGDVDGQYTVPGAAQKQLAGKGSMLYGRSLSPTFLSVLNPNGALADPATRQALQALIDYKGIIESVYGGTAQPLRALVPPEAWGYARDVYQAEYDKLPEPTQDLEKARSLAAASAQARKKIVLGYTPSIEEEAKIATSIADIAAQVGMSVELKPLTAEQFNEIFSSAQARAGMDLFLVTGYLDFPEPLTYYSYFTTGNFYNFAGYGNKDYDADIATATVTEDDAERARLVSKAQAIMATDLVNIPIATQLVNVYYRPGLTGLVPRQNHIYTPWAVELGGA